MLLTDQPDSQSALRLVSLGSLVDISNDLELALNRVIGDPLGYDLFVMECDAFGGLPGAETAISRLIAADARMRVMLIGSAFDEPAYPLGRRSAVSLPAAVSDGAFRHGFDHVLRDRETVTLM
jgi:hypothetical protein